MNIWFKIRLALICLGFLGSLLIPGQPVTEIGTLPGSMIAIIAVASVAGIFLLPLMLLLVIGFQTINPFSDKMWTRPNHQDNPFHFGNPLLFFHFAGYFICVSGLGLLISSLWNGVFVMVHGLFVILGGFSALLGVRLAMRVFKDKMKME